MNQTIIQEITSLKSQYKNMNNTYEISYLTQECGKEITEEYFLKRLKNIINQKWEDVKIIDNKKYIKNDLTLIIDITGEMRCITSKMLKYKHINNIGIKLFNERIINCDNFSGSNKYDKVYKQKKMVFTKEGYQMILTIKTDLDKVTTYEIKIVFKSNVNEQKLDMLFKML